MKEALAFGAWRAGRNAEGRVEIVRAQPIDVSAALIGSPAAAAPAIAKALHALCPMAHGIAVRRALEAAAGRIASPGLEAARVIALEAEAAAAAAFRFGALWAAALGLGVDPQAGAARRAAEALSRAAFEGREDTSSGPALAAALRAVMAGTGQACLERAAPLQDAPDADRPGDSLFDRLLALMLDAEVRSDACGRLCATGVAAPPDPPAPRSGVGQGAAAALRGAVFVSLRVAEGRILNARINTPTDRVLAAGGSLVRALERVSPHLAPLVVLAFDPCAPVVCALDPIMQEDSAYA